MNVMALPLLFNGLFFSLSPAAVHTSPPGKEVAALTYKCPAGALATCEPKTLLTPVPRIVKVKVNFFMNDKKELQVISVSGPNAGLNNIIMQNINLLMPQAKNYFSVNKPYSITLELKYDSMS